MTHDSGGDRHELLAYLPRDRARAMASGTPLADPSHGAILFVDLSGFTALTVALSEHLGPRRGAEAATHQLNQIYEALVAPIHAYDGSVIGFSGDGMMCWFESGIFPTVSNADSEKLPANMAGTDGVNNARSDRVYMASAAQIALCVAAELQRTMEPFQTLEIQAGMTVTLALKTVMAAGTVRRFVAGDPQIQLHDVIAGSAVNAVGIGEQYAAPGENLVEVRTYAALEGHLPEPPHVLRWITDVESRLKFASVVSRSASISISPHHSNVADQLVDNVPGEVLRQWILPQIYTRVAAGQADYLGELRPAVALFGKFGGIDYDQDPAAGQQLDAYIQWVQKVLAHYGGALIQLTTGDKGSYLYACFGAPTTHEDDAIRAVQAAFALQAPSEELRFRPALQIGIAMGRMRVGAYGSTQRKTYGVQGPATNLSARLMMLAADGDVVVDERTARAVRTRFHCESKGLTQVKGNAVAVELFRVLNQDANSQSKPAEQLDGLFGREEILDELVQRLISLSLGRGSVVQVEGPAGIGKSHLLQYFVRICEEQKHRPYLVGTHSTQRDRAYVVVQELVRLLLGIDTETPGEQLQRLESELSLQPLQRILLKELLELPVDSETVEMAQTAPVPNEPQFRQEILIGVIVDLVRQRAQAERLVLIFDDVHWLDEASQEVVVALARVAVQAPFVILLVHRPLQEQVPPFAQQLLAVEGCRLISLAELPPVASGALIASRLHAPLEELGQEVVYRLTHGNPYFIQELIAAMVESGRLVRDTNQWRLSDSLLDRLRETNCLRIYGDEIELRDDASFSAVDLGLPDSIHGAILARIDRLDDSVALTLKTASVIGRVFDAALLATVHPTALGDGELDRHLHVLAVQGFTRSEQEQSERRFSFRHSIIHETVYRTLLLVQQQTLHQRIAQQIESQQPDAVEPLAFHYRHADLSKPFIRDKTLYYLEAAAARAQRQSANETALNYYQRALSIEVRWTWLVQKVRLVHILGRRREEEQTLAQLAEMPDAPRGEIASLRAKYYEATSRYDEALASIAAAHEIFRKSGDFAGRVRCQLDRAMIARRQGEFEQAQAQYQDVLADAGGAEEFELEQADANYGLGITYRQQGEYATARSHFEVALDTYRHRQDRRREADTLTMLGTVEWLQRRFHEAHSYFDRALAIRREIGDRAGQGSSLITKAQAIRALGDYAQAEAYFRQAITILQEVGNRWSMVNAWNELGIIYMLVGDYNEAQEALEFALHACDETGADALRIHILCNLGQVQRDRELVVEAEETLLDALSTARGRHEQLSEAQCLSELGQVYLLLEQYSRAEEMAADAIAIFTRLDLEVMTTADLGTLAQAAICQRKLDRARVLTIQLLDILQACGGEGPDYPQRDYYIAATILRTLGEVEQADEALRSAYKILQIQAGRILNSPMRHKFLTNIAFNNQIVKQAQAYGIEPVTAGP